ncbi:hypothetical protein J416_11085 [Gracilibacillus halophilus YIM-C55.5]|uniref:Spore coat protein n=1 Tax=Gracilibacillus halophilus YIM-C55.5 TaxID=1308866 RepID=N4W7Y4_9BACI|nr:YppG family protein [Gracilibacillus halophilus]ENH96383.1 hypothetical protein J416_11085 [Gracilibacillus halophilus YIM-C55.5]
MENEDHRFPSTQDPFFGSFPYQQQYPMAPNQPMTPYQYFQKPVMPPPYQEMSNQFPPTSGKPKHSVMGMFQNQNGELDVDKVFQTVNQMANTYHQVNPIIKNVGSWIKKFQA